jgi:regulator of protease activity HflC (stomatin/prohibitin superfamily)
MRKIRNIIALIVFSILLIGCDNFITFAVKMDEEAVITQGDEIYGDVKGPGVHYKIPFIQKVYIIQKHLIREYSLNLFSPEYVKATILWNVSDSKKYFLFTRSKSDVEIKKIILAKIESAIEPFSMQILKQIAIAQSKNSKYMAEKSELILKHAQNSIEQYGINLDQILYTTIGGVGVAPK